MNKKRLLFITIIFIICICSLSISVAFIIKETISNNTITFGDIKMKLFVTTINDNREVNVSDQDNFDITYNSLVNRNIKVKNIGNHPMFVRVSFDFLGEDKNKKSINLDNLIDVIQNDTNWIYKDGWYYYNEELKPNLNTEKLMVDFIFDIDKITGEYPGSTIKLDINLEVLQSENNEENVLDAVGWPTE